MNVGELDPMEPEYSQNLFYLPRDYSDIIENFYGCYAGQLMRSKANFS